MEEYQYARSNQIKISEKLFRQQTDVLLSKGSSTLNKIENNWLLTSSSTGFSLVETLGTFGYWVRLVMHGDIHQI